MDVKKDREDRGPRWTPHHGWAFQPGRPSGPHPARSGEDNPGLLLGGGYPSPGLPRRNRERRGDRAGLEIQEPPPSRTLVRPAPEGFISLEPIPLSSTCRGWGGALLGSRA